MIHRISIKNSTELLYNNQIFDLADGLFVNNAHFSMCHLLVDTINIIKYNRLFAMACNK